jgi:DNA-binding GntR family transcriptional regulator
MAVSGSSLHELAYARLGEALMQGEFAPGQQLTFRSLAESLGVSVTPVREAVATLAVLGALRVHPKRFIEVSRLSPEGYLEMLALRRLLEGQAAVLAAERIKESQLQEIVEINEGLMQHARDGRHQRAMKENQRFHFAVYRASGSRYLVENIERLWMLIGPSLNLHLSEEYARDEAVLKSGFENHTVLIEGLASHDSARALAGILGDMTVSCSQMLAGLLRSSDLSINVLKELNNLPEHVANRLGLPTNR